MRAWYTEYWGQTWYKNTFLVEKPKQIGQARGSAREWNNIDGSGCNFTCLAMIIGIDPARLASELSCQKHYFSADRTLKARYVTGKIAGLVWDQNKPHERHRSVKVKNVWHNHYMRRVSIELNFLAILSTKSPEEGNKFVRSIRDRGNHIICGPQDHSHLVAGSIDGEFYLWDPNESKTKVEKSLGGNFRLSDLFKKKNKNDPIEFWEYECNVA